MFVYLLVRYELFDFTVKTLVICADQTYVVGVWPTRIEQFRFLIDKDLIKGHHRIFGMESRRSRSIRHGTNSEGDFSDDSLQGKTERVTSNGLGEGSALFVDEFAGNGVTQVRQLYQ